MYKGVPMYFAKDGEITIRKRRINKRGKISDKEIKIRRNITKIKFNGFVYLIYLPILINQVDQDMNLVFLHHS